MKHIKLFEDVYSTLPPMETDSIKKMTKEEILNYLSMVRKGDIEQFNSIIQPWVYYNKGAGDDYDFIEKLGVIMSKKGLDGMEPLPGEGSAQEWMELNKDSERAIKSLSRSEADIKKSKYEERLRIIREVASLTQEEIFERIRLGKFVIGTPEWDGMCNWLSANKEMATLFYQIEKLFKNGLDKNIKWLLPPSKELQNY